MFCKKKFKLDMRISLRIFIKVQMTLMLFSGAELGGRWFVKKPEESCDTVPLKYLAQSISSLSVTPLAMLETLFWL